MEVRAVTAVSLDAQYIKKLMKWKTKMIWLKESSIAFLVNYFCPF